MTEHEQHIHDPANVTNPEHAEHHIVSPLQYLYRLHLTADRNGAYGVGGRA